MEATPGRPMGGGRGRRYSPTGPKHKRDGNAAEHTRVRPRSKLRADRWRVFAAAMRPDAEACFVAACGTESEAAALAHTLERHYRHAARFWVSRIDLTTRPGAWAELKQRLEPKAKRAPKSATQRFEAQARALVKAKDATEPNAAILRAMAAKERRLAADALKNAIEKRHQAERLARIEVDRRARVMAAVAARSSS